MGTLCLLLCLAVPDRPIERPNVVSWVGKTVYPKISPMYLDESAEPRDDLPPKSGTALTVISYRVSAERANHVQIKTREGKVGWLRKADVVPQEDALAFFTKEIEKNPSDTNGYNRRAAVWRAKGEFDAAIKDASEAIRIRPSAPLYNNRAIYYQAKRDFDKALADYDQALKLNPNYPLALVNRAGLWQAKKEYDKAIADASQAVMFQPALPGAYRARGLAWAAKKEHDKAIGDFSRALQFDPKSGQLHADRAGAHSALKDYAKALDDFNAAIRLEATNVAVLAPAALWLASCPEAKYRDGKRALQLALQAHKLEGNNTQALQALAAAYAEVGQFDDAVRWQEHALNDRFLKSDKNAQAPLESYRQKQPYRRE